MKVKLLMSDKPVSGGHSKREPPESIPNSEVKTLSADDSVSFSCESRSPPGLIPKTRSSKRLRVFFLRALFSTKRHLETSLTICNTQNPNG